MPLTLYLLRHGATPGNEARRYIGATDEQLARSGKYALEQKCQQQKIPDVNTIFCSPMLRCIETASILFPDREPFFLDALREHAFGAFEELTHDQIIRLPGYEEWGKTEESMVFPGGETHRDFDRRCLDAYHEISRICEEQKNTEAAVITHGGVIMSILHQLLAPDQSRYRWQPGNGEGWSLKKDHLGQLTAERLPL